MGHSTWRSLRNPQYGIYLSGQMISVFGTWIQTTTLNWIVYDLTGSVLILGLLNLMSGIIAIPLGLLGGVIADRYSKKRLIMIMQAVMLCQAVIFFLLVSLGNITIWQIFVLEAILAIARAFDFPARETFLYDISGADDLVSAIALDKAVTNVGRMIGPAIAGILIALTGEASAFLLNAASYVVILVLLTLLKSPIRIIKSATKKKTKAAFREGFEYIFQDQKIGSLTLLIAVSALLSMSFTVLLPAIAAKNFSSETMQTIDMICRQLISNQQCHSSEAVLYGIMLSAVGVGSLIGALLLASHKATNNQQKWLQISSILFPLGLIGLGISNIFIVSLILLVALSVARLLQHTIVSTQIQLGSREDLRGRVMSFYTIATQSSLKAGGVQISFLAAWLGVSSTIFLNNGLAIILTIFILAILHKQSSKIATVNSIN